MTALPYSLRPILSPMGRPMAVAIRVPDQNETPLSDAEIWHGVRKQLISTPVTAGRR